MTRRQIRPSQFVTTYGSGAMLPLSSGYVIIPSLDSIVHDLQFRDKFDLNSFQIQDKNMETILSRMYSMPDKRFKIFYMPSNADLNENDNKTLIRASVFPRWSVCNSHSGVPILAQLSKSDTVIIRCPICEKEKHGNRKKRTNRGSSVRFVRACSNGHLDDLDWCHEVHKDFKCNGNIFKWDENNNNNNFLVSCYGYYEDGNFYRTTCGKRVSYFDLRQKSDQDSIACSGLFPEKSLTKKSPCAQPAKLILKNSSNVRLADLVLAVTIPIVPDKFEFMYTNISDFDKFRNSEFTHKDFLDHCLYYNSEYDKNFPIRDIKNSSADEIKDALDRIGKKLKRPPPSDPEFSYEHIIEEEFNSLLEATKNGFPPKKWGESTGLHIEPTDANEPFLNNETGLFFKVSPIRKLVLTRVQRGYSREVSPIPTSNDEDDEPPIHKRSGKLISSYYVDPNHDARWFVGHQLSGEGLFIQLCDPNTKTQQYDPFAGCDTGASKSFTAWNKTYKKWRSELEARRRTNPRFVWWHTVSHKIINQLAVKSGFSSASIAERIYCYENNQRHVSGILLYTAQTGGDGTMGGLVSMAPIFEDLIADVICNLQRCSNDPVCSYREKSRGRFNGVACHACLFASETSCEYHNRFLDRNIVLEMMKK